MTRLAPDAAHRFGGIEIDRTRPLRFRLDGRTIEGFVGDTVLTAALAAGIDTVGVIDDLPIALGPDFAPAVALGTDPPMPMAAAPALDGLTYRTIGARRRRGLAGLRRKGGPSLDVDLTLPLLPDWQRWTPEETLHADLLIVGGGVAGLAAAESAIASGHTVILCERRPWLDGDARYYGALGDDEPPDAVADRLIAALHADPRVTLLARTTVLSPGKTSLALQVIAGDQPRGRIIAISAERVLLATGTRQRLPIFAGNRLPGVTTSIEAYHLAKRYGVVHGATALVSTQSNFAYRLALRLADAGVAVARVADARLNPQSRFVDFAKASGLLLASGQYPLVAKADEAGLGVSLANVGSAAAAPINVSQLIVSGGLQPDLALWMRLGGRVEWDADRLVPVGSLERVALSGSVAGYRSLSACLASGRNAVAALFGGAIETIDDSQIDAAFETPDVPAPVAPVQAGAPAFLDTGTSLARRGGATLPHEVSVGDVAAGVELGMIQPADAGAVVEERVAPGGEIMASSWTPPPRPAEDAPAWLGGRFGSEPLRLRLVVDGKRRFARGALVYANTGRHDPSDAVGVIVAEASPGGIAIVSREARAQGDRFIVQGINGLSPARIAADS
jgi:sarcosine oxidase subunit alpha